MLRKFTVIALAISALVGVQFGAVAATGGTPDEAKAMVEKAAKLLTAEGKDKAFPTFDDPSGGFVDRDLYVFVLDEQGTTVAHGANKALIGKSLLNVKDANGKAFIKEIIDLANSKGEGWVDYEWPNPTTKKIEAKSSFVKKVGDYIVGVGVYKG
ncbi:MAG TPA: cache domain-containing protein [Stellaceae bacterium]|nr:cache domain-containing protein [Stellaceae bacterium]